MSLGSLTIDRVVECERCRFAPDTLFPTLNRTQVRKSACWLDPGVIDRATGELFLSFHSYVVRAKGRVILVDTCSGNHKHRPALPAHHQLDTRYLENLAAAGVRPEDVDVVLCTHLHPDHTGWNTQCADGRWVPTFPNARYLMSAVDFAQYEQLHASRPADPVAADVARSFEDSVLPIAEAGQADLVSLDHRVHDELATGVWFESAAGHSPGQVIIHTKSEERHAVLSADVIHHPIQLLDLGMPMGGDADPAEAAVTRRRLVETYVDTDTLILPAHFPDPSAGRFTSSGGDLRFVWRE
ncbi:MBL fold metallo-hydrolase [Inquilinus limosus]|uniref:MBL fold metallo-hydrolase n=1 Tax=Inquilinus limosus TaxID=171674 RepID=UPI003F137C5E